MINSRFLQTAERRPLFAVCCHSAKEDLSNSRDRFQLGAVKNLVDAWFLHLVTQQILDIITTAIVIGSRALINRAQRASCCPAKYSFLVVSGAKGLIEAYRGIVVCFDLLFYAFQTETLAVPFRLQH
jgi:hypothetical protein